MACSFPTNQAIVVGGGLGGARNPRLGPRGKSLKVEGLRLWDAGFGVQGEMIGRRAEARQLQQLSDLVEVFCLKGRKIIQQDPAASPSA